VTSAEVTAAVPLCREHFRLSMRAEGFPPAYPGQFVHLCPDAVQPSDYELADPETWHPSSTWRAAFASPMLRRAFSIAGLRQAAGATELDVIYRVVGSATQWMASLRKADRVSVLGPLGNVFPIQPQKPSAWLVAGGVGLPPMLWLAEALHQAKVSVIAFCGARSADLLPLSLDPSNPPVADASRATRSCREFDRLDAPIVVSTDDGTLGFHGRIGDALAAYHRCNATAAENVVVYTCGPEPMMRGVAEYCLARGMECYACVERNMACGTGLCQSCVVPVRDPTDRDGWRYRLCCTDGPVFPAADVLWEV
jgi:dihydroorotate dehydrogenase electron transfer subunit